ncbi:capon-like protein isoform X2 [Phlebotomus papatasi]|uniref:capon-like protein isoform X2 n=1 Tax=Phlebotomus papatasi TaxID=29031 RepID=UPI0024835D42|nr:capon-like protein isoform X2 [Phlebotomus papatasi]
MSEMVGHQRREDSPVARDISMSPSSRRRADFTLRQLQNDVMFRARSTLSSLGDVMKRPSASKTTVKPPHKHRSTFDFFLCAKHKKIDSKKEILGENATTEAVTKRPRGKFTRNKSLDCEGGENVPLRRDDLSLSLGENLNWIPEESPPRTRPVSYHEGNVTVKARLKLQKFMSHDESTLNVPKPATIIRQNSHDPRSPTISEDKVLEENHNLELPQKPRKKLSFREPENDAFIRQRSNSLDSELESQAMRIVRTVGQAFEVCHNRKVSAQNTKVTALDRAEDGGSETPCDTSEQDRCSDPLSDDEEPRKEIIPITPEPVLARPNHLDILSQVNYDSRKSPQENEERSTSPLPAAREIQKLKEQLEQQSLQTRQALAQLMLVREQLISETNARVEAQARTQQLLQQNRELLEHIAALGGYHEPDRPSLTAATLGIAPQSPLFLTPTSDGNDLGSPVRKTFAPPNAATLSQLGTINQQLTTLSQQLSGLNQQQQNLHNLQQLTFGANPLPTSFGPPRSTPSSSGELISQQELFQLNAELLSRLQNLNFGQNGTQNGVNNNSPQSSYIFCNSSALSGNNNANLLNSPSSGSNLTPSPLGTLNRSSFSASPLDESLAVSLERNLDASDHETHLIKPLSQVGTLTTLDSEGKVKVLVPISAASSSSKAAVGRKTEKKVTLPEMVTLKVTDESGNVTKKLPATPSFITRSTSEKVPSRSQMMVQVQRTQWARHTTK